MLALLLALLLLLPASRNQAPDGTACPGFSSPDFGHDRTHAISQRRCPSPMPGAGAAAWTVMIE
jgi:hypothetical protein